MPAPHLTWTVLPHGELTPVDDGVLTVVGKIGMPMGQLDRRMTVVRLGDGRLVIFSAIALEEDEMERLEAFGTPAFLIAPDAMHRLDVGIWKDRYPDACVIAPAGARDKVAEVAPVDDITDFGDPDVTLVEVAGTEQQELALEVRRTGGLTLVLNDVVGNIRDAHGLSGAFLKLTQFAGDEPHVPKPIRMKMVRDRPALAAQFRAWAARPALKRILVSHGEVIADDPSGALNRLADSLD
jgi:hypothetical protein